MPPQLRPHNLLMAMAFLMVTFSLSAQGRGTEKRPLIEVRTTAGTIILELFNETPLHRDNFLELVRTHYYDSTLFHRVIPGFIVQGGDPDSRKSTNRDLALGAGGPDRTIPAEILPALIHRKGALGAARKSDDENPDKRSFGSQFYIVEGGSWTAPDLDRVVQRRNSGRNGTPFAYTPAQVADYVEVGGAPRLDGEYTIFGQVVEGMDVIDAITKLPYDQFDRPMTDVRIWMRVLP